MKTIEEIAATAHVRMLLVGSDGAALNYLSLASQTTLRIIISNGSGWDHASVSTQYRIPTWGEMELVRRLVFKDDETVMQIHPPIKDYVNVHPNVLHLWRPHHKTIPRPPKFMV